MYRNNVWVLVGMATEALFAGTAGTFETEFGVSGESILASFAAAMIIIVWIADKKLNRFFVGMALQPLITSTLIGLDITSLLPEFLLVAAGFTLAIIVFSLLKPWADIESNTEEQEAKKHGG